MNIRSCFECFALLIAVAMTGSPALAAPKTLKLEKNTHLVLLGNGLGSRMMLFGHFETEVQRRHAGQRIFIRNMCDEGNTPGFRPHSGRKDPWAFPGAEKYRQLSKAKDRWGSGHVGNGFFQKPDEWLTRLKADVIVAFFGFNESFDGPSGLANFKAELSDFVKHTLAQKYNGQSAPQLVLVSPIAFEDLSFTYGTPDGTVENTNLALYAGAMEDVAAKNNILFVDMYSVSREWYEAGDDPVTRDGALLTDGGYKKMAPALADALFGQTTATGDESKVLAAVREKNWMWRKLYKIPNGVHVYGRRHGPYGPKNYPFELKKLDQMTAIRDQGIWAALEGKSFDLAAADAKTEKLPIIGKVNPKIKYLEGDAALKTLKLAPGYKISLFASEKQFPNLANPVQLSFDNKGRLWVATMPTYPHYRPGDPKPADKLLILEDTNGDGKADKEMVFADNLHLPLGFEFAPEGIYVSQGIDLVLLRDTNADDRADAMEVVFSGFDDHDTHHAISAFCADPSGAILMGEGTFLHSNIETAYGPVRSSNGGFFRYSPQSRKFRRICRLSLPNPWGIAFDDWGQNFFLDTSDPSFRWMMPGSVQVPYGDFAPNPRDLLERRARVRPTSGLEFVSSRHFPDEVQGDVLINNAIGFLGTRQHQIMDDGSGYKTVHRHDLVRGSDPNFRPVDMEFAPDGSLYIVDWHNALIGHMQHNARDVNRDHTHGRVYRITYPARPLIKPVKVAGATIRQLLDNLKLPEYRTRYRTRRELRGRDATEVTEAIKTWIPSLDKSDARYEHHLLEALWVTWGLDQVDASLLRQLLKAKDFRARSAAVKVLRYTGHQVDDQADLLLQAAGDDHGRVRLEAMVAATWIGKNKGLPVVEKASANKDAWMNPPLGTAMSFLQGLAIKEPPKMVVKTTLTGDDKKLFMKGAEIFSRQGYCITCHQGDGQGLLASQFPPLAGSKWAQGSEERMIKLVLHGLGGPIKVKGVKYSGKVPMFPFKFLSDEEVAAVTTFVRNAFGNKSSVITPAKVKAIRELTKDRKKMYTPAELLKEYPH